MEPGGILLAPTQPDPSPPRWEVEERAPAWRSETRQIRAWESTGAGRQRTGGGGGRQLRQLKSFNGCTSQIFLVTLTRLLQARQRAPAGSTGCGYKCSLLLSAQGNCVCVWGVVVSSAWARGNKLGTTFNCSWDLPAPLLLLLPLLLSSAALRRAGSSLARARAMLRADPVPALCARMDNPSSPVPGKAQSPGR